MDSDNFEENVLVVDESEAPVREENTLQHPGTTKAQEPTEEAPLKRVKATKSAIARLAKVQPSKLLGFWIRL